MSRLLFGLRLGIQTTIAYETEKLDNRKRLFEKVVEIARKEIEVYHVRLINSTVDHEELHTSPF